jgi:hypothetical protein
MTTTARCLLALVPAALLLSSSARAGSLKILDKGVFRDVAFGQTCNEIEGLKGNTAAVKAAVKAGMGTDPKDGRPYLGMLQYSRASDELQVGQAELLGITYTCYMEQLLAVQVHAFGTANSKPLMDALVEAYGEPSSGDEDVGRWTWEGKKALLTYTRDPLTDMATATWVGVKMLETKRKNDIAIKKSAVNDL